jgi:hypothetical protein
LRTTACPGSWDSCPFPPGPAVSLIQGVAVELRSNANPDAIICEHMETWHGATRPAFSSLNRQCIGLVGRRVSRLARTRISRQGLRAGSTNRCSGHVVPKVVATRDPRWPLRLPRGPCMLARRWSHCRFATGCGPGSSLAGLSALQADRCSAKTCYYSYASDTIALECGSRLSSRPPAAARDARQASPAGLFAHPSTTLRSLFRPATEREISVR